MYWRETCDEYDKWNVPFADYKIMKWRFTVISKERGYEMKIYNNTFDDNGS